MIEIEDLPTLHRPLLVAAFAGWNDAGEAATTAVDHLIDVWQARPVGAVDPDDYYDFQVNRPYVGADAEGMRQVTWPGTQVLLARPPGSERDVVLLRGVEPSMRWRQFVSEVLAVADDLGVELVVTLGALLSDASHSRPTPVSGTATELDLEDRLSLEGSTYEGPTGIVGVLLDACQRLDFPAVSFWAGVPHYVPHGPNYKAALALLEQVEEVLDANVERRDLDEDARAWQRGADEYVASDEEAAAFAEAYERDHDAQSLPEASGDAIAAEFERYLKRRDRDA